MGLFDIFGSKSITGGDLQGTLLDYEHKRYHARYIVNNRDLSTIEHVRHGLFRVVDLSHHGCLVEAVADASFDNCSLPTIVDLSVCGSNLRLEVSQCQRRKTGWGLIFRHVHESSIRSLGQFIEPLRCGSSVESLPVDATKDGVMTKMRRRFQGDGPFELVFERDTSGQLVFLMATFRIGNHDGSVIWEHGDVITKKSDSHEGARMARTSDVDRDLVWTCAVSCLGMKFAEGALCAKALSDWLSANTTMTFAKSS